ncbi:MAG: zinc ribbon domain-containing protein, partial [Candidatus Kariarchaeaceae archaeon]
MSFETDNISTFCTQCGTENKGLDVFCGSCGFTMKKGKSVEAEPSPSYQAVVSDPVQTEIQPQANATFTPHYPAQQYPGAAIYAGQSYPVRWQDAAKITVGIILFIAGVWFGFLAFTFFVYNPGGALIFFIFLTAIPIYVGYYLLSPFMGGGDMIKASVLTFIAG